MLQEVIDVNADRGILSDDADGISCDGSTAPASVRDAAIRALQSSDSVRRRLVHAGSGDSTAGQDVTGVPAPHAELVGYCLFSALIFWVFTSFFAPVLNYISYQVW